MRVGRELNMQQRMLLTKYLSGKTEGGGRKTVVDLTETGTTPRSILQSRTPLGSQQVQEEPDIMNDPQFYLQGGCASGNKYHDIYRLFQLGDSSY